MLKRAVEFSKGLLSKTETGKREDKYPIEVAEVEIEPILSTNFTLNIEVTPVYVKGSRYQELVPNKSALGLYYSADEHNNTTADFLLRGFTIAVDEESNKEERSSWRKASTYIPSQYADDFAALTPNTYSTTLTELTLSAIDAADDIFIRIQHHGDSYDGGLACAGIQDALRITNSFCKVKSFGLNVGIAFFPTPSTLAQKHFDFLDAFKDKLKIEVKLIANCIPANIIVRWITEWQNHEREIGSLLFDTDQFTDLDEILASVNFSYKDDGNVYAGIVKRSCKETKEQSSSSADQDELWFWYFRQFQNQKPRIKISTEKSVRPQ